MSFWCFLWLKGSAGRKCVSSSWKREERRHSWSLLGSSDGFNLCICCMQRQVTHLLTYTLLSYAEQLLPMALIYHLFANGCKAKSAICVSLSSRQSFYSPPEKSFANSWLNSAEYVSAAHFQSNLANSAMFITPLPGRVLQASPHSYIFATQYVSYFYPLPQICTSRQATLLLTLLTWVLRKTTHCISSPGWVKSTVSWVGQIHIHQCIASFFWNE